MKLAGLASLFLLTACLYASVGFGGGSTYTALLVATGTEYQLVPIIALSCNIVVVSGNTFRYTLERIVPWHKLWPILLASVPLSWLGGRLEIPETLFIILLAIALLFAGVRLTLSSDEQSALEERHFSAFSSFCLGGGIGLYSGLVGIGGGIFLAPVLYALGWGRAKTIAAGCSVFILFNSTSGFLGQYMKLSDNSRILDTLNYWPLLLAVLLGSVSGNLLSAKALSQLWVKKLTGILILLVAFRLIFELLIDVI